MKGCKQMDHFWNLSNFREALIQPLKVNSPKTKKPLAARGAHKCLRVIYPWLQGPKKGEKMLVLVFYFSKKILGDCSDMRNLKRASKKNKKIGNYLEGDAHTKKHLVNLGRQKGRPRGLKRWDGEVEKGAKMTLQGPRQARKCEFFSLDDCNDEHSKLWKVENLLFFWNLENCLHDYCSRHIESPMSKGRGGGQGSVKAGCGT